MHDLVIAGGRVIDPAQGLDGRYDVAFQDGKVAEVAPGIDPARAAETVSAEGALVVPGLIDLHTHVWWGGTSLSVRPEPVARRSGATTLVDAGSAGPGNFHGFRAFVIEPSPVRILPYLNISFAGIFAFSEHVMVGECSDVRLLDARACLEVAQQHRDLIVGIKVRVGRNTSEAYGVFPLELAVEVAEELALPVMAHIDFPPPRRRDMLDRLQCSDVRLLDARACLEVAEQHRDLIVGIKVRVGRNTSEGYGVFPLELAVEVAEELALPVMAHIDFPPPRRRDMLDRLRPGDVLTHCFRPFPNAPVVRGEVRQEMLEARERGVLFDLGHGMGGFGFASTRPMLDAGFLPDVISSDVHVLSEHGPAFDLLHTMSKLHCLGMSLPEVISAVTVRPAEALRRPELGTLAPGAAGDAAVLDLIEGSFEYVDVMGERITGERRLEVRHVIVGGALWHSAAAAA